MINSVDMWECEPVKCCHCGKEVSQWIDLDTRIVFCVLCAQWAMRVLFQDLIGYHNNMNGISLLDIMFHGDERKNPGGKLYPWNPKQKLYGKK